MDFAFESFNEILNFQPSETDASIVLKCYILIFCDILI